MRSDDRAGRMLRLLEYLNAQERAVPVSELAELAGREFGVSEVTLRSDLAALSALAPVRKLSRGLYEAARDDASSSLLSGTLFATRLRLRSEAKIAIAGAAVRALESRSELRVLLLDAGSTTYYVADLLAERAGLDLIVWTPSVAAASRLAGSRGISVRLLGGEYRADYAVVSGDETARALRELAGPEALHGEALPSFPGTHCVLDVNYIAADGRLLTDESNERLQKRLMAELAEEVTVVADRGKLFGRRLGLQAHEICALRELAGKRSVRLVTDSGATPEQREELRRVFAAAFPGREIEESEERGAVTLAFSGSWDSGQG